MAINKAMKIALKAMSFPDIDLKKTYKLKRQLTNAAHPYLKPLYNIWDHKIQGADHDIPVRIFMPQEEYERKILIFFHGGGFVTGNIDSYSSACAHMAKQTKHIVVSVDYRLAPEYPFPSAVEDCYMVTREIFMDSRLFDVRQENITLIGDSAGGNLAAVVSLLGRDRKEFIPSRQILLYPSTFNDHTQTSPFPSVHEYANDYLLTSKKICDYTELYLSKEEDRYSPYFAPLLAEDLSNQPKTLIITSQYDPLRDEGEAYARKLSEFGNQAYVYRMKDALHGFILLPKHFVHVKKCYERINQFLNNE